MHAHLACTHTSLHAKLSQISASATLFLHLLAHRLRSSSADSTTAASFHFSLPLHLISCSRLPQANGTYQVKYSSQHLGCFDTAVEGAVAYARHALAFSDEAETETQDATGFVTRAGGFDLHLSTRHNATGYLGIVAKPNGRFEAQCGRQMPSNGSSRKSLGCFDTAVEAGVAYARHAAASGHALEKEEEEDGDGRDEDDEEDEAAAAAAESSRARAAELDAREAAVAEREAAMVDERAALDQLRGQLDAQAAKQVAARGLKPPSLTPEEP